MGRHRHRLPGVPVPPLQCCVNVGQLHCDPAPSRLFDSAKEELLTRVLERVSARGVPSSNRLISDD